MAAPRESSQVKLATDWSRDGRFILVNSVDPKGAYDVWSLALSEDHQQFPIANTGFEERDGQFSPDADGWRTRQNESGRFEVYVQSFPGAGEKLLVSPTGGGPPRWRKDGKELFYVAPDNRLMAVPVADCRRRSASTLEPFRLFSWHPWQLKWSQVVTNSSTPCLPTGSGS